jgi:mRNA-degrading endonuclease RelE of RelBE toxin-antitoxin system
VSEVQFLEFVWLPSFERSSKGLLSEEARRDLELVLVADPHSGGVMPRTGGFRKLRWRGVGRGKRGGSRVVYFYVAERERIYMVAAYGKESKEDLTEAERAELRKLASLIKGGS